MLVRLVLCALLCACYAFEKESRIVRTAQGPVRGYKEDGLYQFYSIPYASAPTGIHKFKAPNPAPVWLDTFDAVLDGTTCPQGEFMPGFNTNAKMQEDCLVANVFAPDTEETNLPVLVVVHGGAYQIGSGSMFIPLSMVKSKKIVAVSFNYRLGAHGFLCLGTEYAPGNAGMKDMVALLRWVKRNIKAFGGNPDDVTISGASAGSSAVDLIQLSKSANGLFNKVIPESGANLAPWSIQMDPLQSAKEFAELHDFHNVDDIYALEEFYKNAPLDVLTKDSWLDRYNSTFGFGPCVERYTGSETFLEKSPADILKSGDYIKRPLLYGFSEKEGLFRLGYGKFETWKDKMNENFADFLPADLQFENEKEKEKVAEQVKEFYFGSKPVSDETVEAYINYYTDVIFAYSTLRSVRLQVEAGNDKIFLYEYSFVGEENLMPNPTMERLGVKGADHCAQSFAVYDISWLGIKDDSKFSERSKKMRTKMRELWLNFITKGAPVPEGSSFTKWPPADVTGSPHMSLDEVMELRGPLLEKRMRFWDGIYGKYYRNPVPPPAPPPRHSEL